MKNLTVHEVVNFETGEVVEVVRLEDLQEEQARRKANNIQGMKLRKSKEELNSLIDGVLGSFYFHQYTELLEELAGDTALAFRFLYLCTYADYDGVLMYGNYRNKKHHSPMQERDLIEVFGLSATLNRSVRKELYSHNLIEKDSQGRLSINKKYCSRGKQSKKSLQTSVRVFDAGLQDVYSTVKPTDHKKVGILFALLPYVNKSHNVLCFNPQEQDIAYIETMTIQDIARAVDYGVAKARRLEKELLNVRVDGEYSLLGANAGDTTHYYINPKLYYAGSELESLKSLISMFELLSK